MNPPPTVHNGVASATNDAGGALGEPKIIVTPKQRSASAERAAKMYAERLALGVCVRCEKPNPRGTYRCEECTAKTVASNEAKKSAAERDGLCVICRKPWIGRTKSCDECKRKTNTTWAARREDKLICVRCLKVNRQNGLKTCIACNKLRREEAFRVRKEKEALGVCVTCRKERGTPYGLYCVECKLKADAIEYLGQKSMWRSLWDMYVKQGCKCAYTGQAIFIGGNASIDHIIPRSKGGTDTIDNLQWVTWTVNRSKNDMTHEEFVRMCEVISTRKYRLDIAVRTSQSERRSCSSAG